MENVRAGLGVRDGYSMSMERATSCVRSRLGSSLGGDVCRKAGVVLGLNRAGPRTTVMPAAWFKGMVVKWVDDEDV